MDKFSRTSQVSLHLRNLESKVDHGSKLRALRFANIISTKISTYRISSNHCHLRIVAAQSEALSEINAALE